MRTILKNVTTGLYYQGVSDWTGRSEEAFDFQRPERAVRFVRAAGLDPRELELVFAFEQTRYNLSVPLDERFGIKADKRKLFGRSSARAILTEPGTLSARPNQQAGLSACPGFPGLHV